MNLLDKLKVEKKTAVDFLRRELETLRGLMEEDIEALGKEQFADLSDLDRHYDMVKFYRRRIGFLNEMSGLVANEDDELKQQIREVALRHAADYPNIESVEPHEQLYAVDQTCQGIALANATCHQFMVALGERLGMTKEQTYEEFGKVVQGVVKSAELFK